MTNLKLSLLFIQISILIGSSGVVIKLHEKALSKPVGLNELGHIEYFLDFNKAQFKGSKVRFSPPRKTFFYHAYSNMFFIDQSSDGDFSFLQHVVEKTSKKTPLHFYSNSEYTLSEANKYITSKIDLSRKITFKHLASQSICFQKYCTSNMIGIRIGQEEKI